LKFQGSSKLKPVRTSLGKKKKQLLILVFYTRISLLQKRKEELKVEDLMIDS
jgi:hypothetical protein